MKTFRWMFALALPLSLAVTTGCSGKSAKVEVRCAENGAGDTECVVTHQSGELKTKMCWQVVNTCENGEKVTGSGCEVVAKGEKKTHVIAKDKFTNKDKCDKLKSSEVANLKATKAE